MTTIDIILPLYRPKPTWEIHVLDSIQNLSAYYAERDCEVRFVIVNDGSPLQYFPETVLAELKRANAGFRFLTYDQNHGKGYSLRFAIRQCDGDYQIYTDGDFPFGWESVARADEELRGGSDVAMGVRGSDYGAALTTTRKMLSRNVRKMNRLLLGLPEQYLDTQAGLKGFNAKGRKAFLATTVDTFLFDTEFILLAWKNHLKIGAVPMTLRPGLHFSRMGLKVMTRELYHFARVLLRHRLTKQNLFPEEKA